MFAAILPKIVYQLVPPPFPGRLLPPAGLDNHSARVHLVGAVLALIASAFYPKEPLTDGQKSCIL